MFFMEDLYAKGMRTLRKLRFPDKSFTTGVVLIASLSWQAEAVPLDNTFTHPGIEISDPSYDISIDAQDPKVFYIAPKAGLLVVNRGMPALSYATAKRDGNTFGVINAAFSFAISRDDFAQIKSEIKQQVAGAKVRPLAFNHTVPDIAIAGFQEDQGACFTAEDFITGEEIKQCINFVYRTKLAQKGPQLGEELGISMVLSPSGVDILPNLLRGGAGLMVRLEGIYQAALPGFKAVIEADYKKLYESYAWYAGYHDGVCTDIAVSDFFEKEVACAANNTNMNGRPCSIKVKYTDTIGREYQNIFSTIPDKAETDEVKAWYKEHSDRINTLWTAIDGLRKDFENKFLEPVTGRRAEVDKTPTLGYAFRADRSRSEEMGSYRFERDMIQSVGPKRKGVDAYTICINVNGNTGAVGLSNLGQCPSYWNGSLSGNQMLPVIEEFSFASNEEAEPVIGPIDWD